MKQKKILYADEQLTEIAFLLGGIGAGCISIGGFGNLRDFEIFDKPAKGFIPQRTFFAIFARSKKHSPSARVVQGPIKGSLNFPHGYNNSCGAGLRHFSSNTFESRFPFAELKFHDADFPVEVTLEAFSPFLPFSEDDSSIPGAIFCFHVKNKLKEKTEISIAFNTENIVGHPKRGGGRNRFVCDKESGLKGIIMTNPSCPSGSSSGSIAISSPASNIKAQTAWTRGAWFDNIQIFWEKFSKSGEIHENYKDSVAPENINDIASINIKAEILPGESKSIPVFLTWHFPNYVKYFDEEPCDSSCCGGGGEKKKELILKKYYAKNFKDAFDSAKYLAKNFERLYSQSKIFSDLIFKSSIPIEIIDAVTANLSTLKSQTCLYFADGSFYAFEGCNSDSGCCHGTCSHVWNYAQTHAFLFPKTAREIRLNDYKYNMDSNGHLNFRSFLPPTSPASHNFHAAADGQLGGIIQVYREWMISGDDKWLRDIWGKAEKALRYAFNYWDSNKDGVIDGVMHNTYDIEFHGANPMIQSIYLTALKCAELICEHLGETDKADEYNNILKNGVLWTDLNLFNGEYYIQIVNPDAYKSQPEKFRLQFLKNKKTCLDPKLKIPKYQYTDGCLSDQILGEWLAEVVGVASVLNRENVLKTLRSIYKYNFKNTFKSHSNTQRIYAADDESGLILCSWKDEKNRPTHPFPYSDEVWTGIEYQVAAHLIFSGMTDEGIEIVRAARKRYDGRRRNPFNEIECGNHYARALSGYSLLLAVSGAVYNAPKYEMSFFPKISQKDFKCLFTAGLFMGMYKQKVTVSKAVIQILPAIGEFSLKTLIFPLAAKKIKKANIRIGEKKFEAGLILEGGKCIIDFGAVIKIKSEKDKPSSLAISIVF